jgi:hypothetical protein
MTSVWPHAAGVTADVLQEFTAEQLALLTGDVGAYVMYLLVRVSFLASICTIFPMQVRSVGQREGLAWVASNLFVFGICICWYNYACHWQDCVAVAQRC